jgi:hypothetical protein
MTLTFLAVAGVVCFAFWAMCIIADRPVRHPDTIDPRNVSRCDTTGCPYAGWIPVTRRDTKKDAEVCAGCWAEGEAYGWWVA